VREFTPVDIPTVREIAKRSLKEEYPPSLFLNIHQWWAQGFLVCEVDGLPAGFIAGVVSREHQARILMLAIEQPYRGNGLGSALLRQFVHHCLDRGMKSLELEVRKSNLGALRFYGRFGFQTVNQLPAFYNDGEDGYKMWMPL